ncbi:MAG: hypothetical protein M3R24_14300 [Chloroflexota bacterium]|nr:hypothetical protein [Chloroflexota bacterium]PLS83811.1 MAG: hypothetical protein CYG59_00075 [Chloroflexota bacterium]
MSCYGAHQPGNGPCPFRRLSGASTDTYLLPVIEDVLRQLVPLITNKGASVQQLLPYKQLRTAYIAALIENNDDVTPDWVREAVRTVALIDNQQQRGEILALLAREAPVDMLEQLTQRVAELTDSADRGAAENILSERHRSGRNVWSQHVHGVSSTTAAARW